MTIIYESDAEIEGVGLGDEIVLSADNIWLSLRTSEGNAILVHVGEHDAKTLARRLLRRVRIRIDLLTCDCPEEKCR